MTPTSSVQNVNWGKKKLLHKRMQGKYPIFNMLDRAAEFLPKDLRKNVQNETLVCRDKNTKQNQCQPQFRV